MDTGEFLILAMCVIVIGLLVFGVMYGRDLRKEIDKELDPFPFEDRPVGPIRNTNNNPIKHILYKGWIIQVQQRAQLDGYMAWASRKPTDSPLECIFSEDSVFGVDGPTENKVIEDLKLELDAQSEVPNVR